MANRKLDKMKAEILRFRRELLASVPCNERRELERQAEIDIPQFMARHKSAFDWLNQNKGGKHD